MAGMFDDLIPPQGGKLGVAGPPADFQAPAKPGIFDDMLKSQEQQPAPAAAPSGGMFDDLIQGNQSQPMSGDVPVHGKPFTLMDTWPVRLAKSVYDAATLPGDVYQGNAVVPQSSNMLGGEDTSSINRVTNLGALTGVAEFGGLTKTAPPTAAMLKNAATEGYNAANKVGIELRPQALDSFGVGLRSKLAEQGLDAEIAPKTHAVLNKLSNYPADSTVTAQNLRTIQKSLGNVKNMSADPAERMTAGQALGEFNNLLENMDQVPSALSKGTPEDAAAFSQGVKEANANYAAYKQSEGFDFRGDKAEYATNASHSGMNLENNLRSQVKQILSNPKQMRGLDDNTIQALKDFNSGGRAANTMRMVGNLLGGGGGLGMLAAGSVSHLLGLPFELGPGVGLGLKSLANQRAASQFNNIGNLMRANSPLAKSGVTSQTPANGLGVLGHPLRITIPMDPNNQPPQ